MDGSIILWGYFILRFVVAFVLYRRAKEVKDPSPGLWAFFAFVEPILAFILFQIISRQRMR